MLPLAFFIHLGFSYGDIEVHANLRGREPSAGVVGAEADGVVSRFVRSEGEFALGETARVDYFISAVDFLLDVKTSRKDGSVTRAGEEGKRGARERTCTTIWMPSWSLTM